MRAWLAMIEAETASTTMGHCKPDPAGIADQKAVEDFLGLHSGDHQQHRARSRRPIRQTWEAIAAGNASKSDMRPALL